MLLLTSFLASLPKDLGYLMLSNIVRHRADDLVRKILNIQPIAIYYKLLPRPGQGKRG